MKEGIEALEKALHRSSATARSGRLINALQQRITKKKAQSQPTTAADEGSGRTPLRGSGAGAKQKVAAYWSSNSPARPWTKYSKSIFEGSLLPSTAVVGGAKQGYRLRILRADRRLRNPKSKPWFFLETSPIVQRKIQTIKPHIKMLNYLELVVTPTADTAGTNLYVHFDNRRYLFGNIVEGTQRAMIQRNVAMKKFDNVFVTGPVNSRNTGGLLGMVLTLADVLAAANEALKQGNEKKKRAKVMEEQTISRMSVHGGRNLAHSLATARRFVFRKGLPIDPHEVREDPRILKKDNNEPDWKDENINVWYVPVVSAASRPPRKRSHDEISGSDEKQNDGYEQVLDVMSHMFNSDWTMDALIETTLHQAKLPAKLFVRDEKGHIQVYEGPRPGNNQNVPDIPVLVRKPWPGATVTDLPRTEPAHQSMCYIIKNHDRRGKFNPVAANKYGVVPRDFSKLTRGENVTGADGVMVTPDMVMGETVLGKGFAILDVPDVSYIEPLINRTEWTNEDIMKGIQIILWLPGPDVVKDARIQEFMKKHDSLKHIVCSADHAPNMIAFESVSAQAYRLHLIDPDRFHLPIYSNESSLTNQNLNELANETYELGRTGKMVQFSPQYKHEDDKIVPFPDLAKMAEAYPNKVLEMARLAKEKISEPSFQSKVDKVESDIPNRDAEIITLGTGSAIPSKYRNVSGTLVRVPEYGNYLFDCGENTIGQMRRMFGNDLPSVLRDLRVIWISHLHADHLLGTIGVIKAWHDATKESDPSQKLHVASHTHMLQYLREYSDVEDFGYSRLTFSDFNKSYIGTQICEPRIFGPSTTTYGVERIDACFVQHCYGSLATVFTWPSGLKIAYSGDCRPSDPFVKMGQGATLLIHESTFDDELQGDAKAKKHCTMSEAIDVGRRMGARRILLTHFSQRYQKVPTFDEESFEVVPVSGGDKKVVKKDEVVLVAFDYMRVRLGEFRHAQAFLPALQKLFEIEA